MNKKLNYSPRLRALLESFLEDRKSKFFGIFVHIVCYTFFFIIILRERAPLVDWFMYLWMLAECVAFYYLYSVDNILRPRFQTGIMLTQYSEVKIFLKWAKKMGPQELQEANFLISEVLEKSFDSYPDKEEEEE